MAEPPERHTLEIDMTAAPVENPDRYPAPPWNDITSPVTVTGHHVAYASPFPHVVYLTGASGPGARAAAGAGAPIGLLVTPDTGYLNQLPSYRIWGADNGCYGAHMRGVPFDTDRWRTWVDTLPAAHLHRCVFVTVPDVVFDAEGTLAQFDEHAAFLHDRGLPAALVAQDGVERLDIPWDRFSALFLGGSTEWKLSPAAAVLAEEARERGKWVHAGRVNSDRRLAHVASGSGGAADSADGTFLAYGPRVNLPKLLTWLDRAHTADYPDGQEHRFTPTTGYATTEQPTLHPSSTHHIVMAVTPPPLPPANPTPTQLATYMRALADAAHAAPSITLRHHTIVPQTTR